MQSSSDRGRAPAERFARAAVGLVGLVNVACALAFLLEPERYAPAFELAGTPGRVAVQAFGLLFLMWNATYPPVLIQPRAHRALFGVILLQQALGLAGETWLWLGLPPEHAALRATGLRFIVFDGFGLLLMGAAFGWLERTRKVIGDSAVGPYNRGRSP